MGDPGLPGTRRVRHSRLPEFPPRKLRVLSRSIKEEAHCPNGEVSPAALCLMSEVSMEVPWGMTVAGLTFRALSRSDFREVGMNIDKYICFLSLVALGSLAVSAECKPGYQSAKMVKVLAVSAGPSAPAQEESPQPNQSARLVRHRRQTVWAAHAARFRITGSERSGKPWGEISC